MATVKNMPEAVTGSALAFFRAIGTGVSVTPFNNGGVDQWLLKPPWLAVPGREALGFLGRGSVRPDAACGCSLLFGHYEINDRGISPKNEKGIL